MSTSRRTFLAGALSTAFLAGCSSPSGRGGLDAAYPLPATADGTKPVTVRKVGAIGADAASLDRPLIAGDVIATGIYEGPDRRFIVGLAGQGLKELWRLPQFVEVKPYRKRQLIGGADSLVFIAEKTGGSGRDEVHLVALDARSGKERWRSAMVQENPNNVLEFMGAHGKVGLFSQLLDTTRCEHTAIDLTTGKQLWSTGAYPYRRVQLLGDSFRATDADGKSAKVLDLRSNKQLAGAQVTGTPGLQWDVPNVLIIGTSSSATVLDVRTKRVLLKAPFVVDGLGHDASGSLLAVNLYQGRSVTAADPRPRVADQAQRQGSIARIARGAIWGQWETKAQPVDRTGKALAAAVPGMVHQISDGWLIMSEGEGDDTEYVLHQLS